MEGRRRGNGGDGGGRAGVRVRRDRAVLVAERELQGEREYRAPPTPPNLPRVVT